jgi:hypothetical protein
MIKKSSLLCIRFFYISVSRKLSVGLVLQTRQTYCRKKFID